MDELLRTLPKILFYIVVGYCYIKSYRYVRILENDKSSINNSLIEYLIIGFVIRSIFSLIPYSINYIIDNVIISICALILGFCAAKTISSRWFTKACYKLNILQTPNKYMWQAIDDNEHSTFVKVTNDKGYTIQGLLVRTETFQRFPIIQVAYYTVSYDGVIIYNHQKEPEWTMLIDTSKYDSIQYQYLPNSKKIENWKKLY